MDKVSCIFSSIVAICITVIICVVTITSTNNTKELIKQGYKQVQQVGGQGVYWIK
jgi:hypothetical protein